MFWFMFIFLRISLPLFVKAWFGLGARGKLHFSLSRQGWEMGEGEERGERERSEATDVGGRGGWKIYNKSILLPVNQGS